MTADPEADLAGALADAGQLVAALAGRGADVIVEPGPIFAIYDPAARAFRPELLAALTD